MMLRSEATTTEIVTRLSADRVEQLRHETYVRRLAAERRNAEGVARWRVALAAFLVRAAERLDPRKTRTFHSGRDAAMIGNGSPW